LTTSQLAVLRVVVSRIQTRTGAQPTQVPAPPVQVPPLAEGLMNFVAAAVGEAQPVTEGEGAPCGELPQLALTNSVDPDAGDVGDSVSVTHTVTNPGPVPLDAVLIESDLPDGLDFVSASSGGSVDPDTGYVEWMLSNGLPAGGSSTLSISAATSDPGQWDNHVCSAGLDAVRNEASDCERHSPGWFANVDAHANQYCDTHGYPDGDADCRGECDSQRGPDEHQYAAARDHADGGGHTGNTSNGRTFAPASTGTSRAGTTTRASTSGTGATANAATSGTGATPGATSTAAGADTTPGTGAAGASATSRASAAAGTPLAALVSLRRPPALG
jgi:uncharacterized repeat protein (TIGR01451 family)